MPKASRRTYIVCTPERDADVAQTILAYHDPVAALDALVALEDAWIEKIPATADIELEQEAWIEWINARPSIESRGDPIIAMMWETGAAAVMESKLIPHFERLGITPTIWDEISRVAFESELDEIRDRMDIGVDMDRLKDAVTKYVQCTCGECDPITEVTDADVDDTMQGLEDLLK